MKRQFWLIPCHEPTEYRPLRPIALPVGMTLTDPVPVAGPWPFTPDGLEAMHAHVFAKYGTTAAEWVDQDAEAVLMRLASNHSVGAL